MELGAYDSRSSGVSALTLPEDEEQDSLALTLLALVAIKLLPSMFVSLGNRKVGHVYE